LWLISRCVVIRGIAAARVNHELYELLKVRIDLPELS